MKPQRWPLSTAGHLDDSQGGVACWKWVIFRLHIQHILCNVLTFQRLRIFSVYLSRCFLKNSSLTFWRQKQNISSVSFKNDNSTQRGTVLVYPCNITYVTLPLHRASTSWVLVMQSPRLDLLVQLCTSWISSWRKGTTWPSEIGPVGALFIPLVNSWAWVYVGKRVDSIIEPLSSPSNVSVLVSVSFSQSFCLWHGQGSNHSVP